MAERIDDLNLPVSVVTRIVKESLPSGVNISKESQSAIAKAASVFVLYITSAANVIATSNKKKTITGKDVIQALENADFADFVPSLEEALENFKRTQKEKKLATAKKKSKEDAKDEEASEELVVDDEESGTKENVMETE